jgi:hypothetical protein
MWIGGVKQRLSDPCGKAGVTRCVFGFLENGSGSTV